MHMPNSRWPGGMIDRTFVCFNWVDGPWWIVFNRLGVLHPSRVGGMIFLLVSQRKLFWSIGNEKCDSRFTWKYWIGSPKILLVGQAFEPGCIFKKQFLKAKSDFRGNLSWWKLISISVMDINNQIQDTVVGWRVVQMVNLNLLQQASRNSGLLRQRVCLAAFLQLCGGPVSWQLPEQPPRLGLDSGWKGNGWWCCYYISSSCMIWKLMRCKYHTP